MSQPGEYVQPSAVTIVANNDSGYGSRVPASAGFVTVSAVTNDANDWIVLPVAVQPGHVVEGWTVAAHEMRTEASSGIKINNVDSDGTQEAAIPATTLWKCTYISSTVGWILEAKTELGAVVTAIVPD